MSDDTPPPPAAATGLDSHRMLFMALGAVAVVLGIARTAGPGGLAAALALLLLVGVPIVGAQLGGAGGRVFFLVSALGAWLVFRPAADANALSVPGHVLNRLAYFAVPPLVLSLALSPRDQKRLNLGWLHLYAPGLAMGLGALVHLAVAWGDPGAEAQIERAAAIYAGCYLVLIMIGVVLRLAADSESAALPAAAGPDRALALEEVGRFGVAAQLYERQGEIEKAAQAAERAGDWPRAARLFRQAGRDFEAAEMYYRAQMPAEALASYERAGDLPAAARLCVQLGQIDRALALFERSGYSAALVKTLEEFGHRPSAQQYRAAGMLDRAAQAYEEGGALAEAAEIHEHELDDRERAAALYLKAGSFLQAGRLFEALGKRQDALEAYAATPAGSVDAARLFLAAGRTAEAANLVARIPAAQLATLEDESTLTLVARVMLETDRLDEAARILQGLKRRGAIGGPVHLLLGRAFLDKGLHELAEEELRIAAGMPLDAADEIQAAYLLGRVLEATGKPEEAMQVFQGVLQKDLQYRDVQERYRKLKAEVAVRVKASIE
jgi:tetratricopeptide (TPR) repeat protein